MDWSEASASTVIIVDDEAAMRDSLAALVAAADYRCLAFASGEAFLAAPLPPIPRCLLLDMGLDGLSGLDVQQALNAQAAPLPILVVSGEDNVARATRAMKAGAMDYLPKPFDPEHLLARIGCALQASVDGENRRRAADHNSALLARLTDRQRQVMALLVAGSSNKQIAQTLAISRRTVDNHREQIMAKLQARTVADLVRIWRQGDRVGG